MLALVLDKDLSKEWLFHDAILNRPTQRIVKNGVPEPPSRRFLEEGTGRECSDNGCSHTERRDG